MKTAALTKNMRVKVVAGPLCGREGQVITLPIPGKVGITVQDDQSRAFWVQEAFVEPVGMEVQHGQDNN